MKTRTITAFFFTIVMLASIFSGAIAFSGFYFLLSMAALAEFYKLLKQGGKSSLPVPGMFLAAALFIYMAGVHLFSREIKDILFIIPFFIAVFIMQLYRHDEEPFSGIANTFLGVLYVMLPFCFFYALGFLQEGTYHFLFPLAFLLMLWANDTGAYLFGMSFGKHRLFERHSPKKSWEGFFGGIFIGMLVAAVLHHFYPVLSLPVWLGMAVIISCFGTWGDLVESMLKRSLNVKDSGSFLPGHGGLLDRFDGLLIAAPLVYLYLSLFLN